jgi:hypothetical protein
MRGLGRGQGIDQCQVVGRDQVAAPMSSRLGWSIEGLLLSQEVNTEEPPRPAARAKTTSVGPYGEEEAPGDEREEDAGRTWSRLTFH